MAAETHRALVGHLELERQMGGYAAAKQGQDSAPGQQEGASITCDPHEAIAKLLGSSADEVALAESAQVAWAKAFYSMHFREGDRILCFESEYAGNAVAFLQAMRRAPVALEILPMRPDGIIDVPALERALERPMGRGRTLVALTHCGSAESVVQPAARVGRLCRQHGAIYLLDACQTVGQLPVDVEELQCDFLCGTGRKWLRGPRGTGFLYARRSVLDAVGRDDDARGGPLLVGEPPMVDHTSVRWVSKSEYHLEPSAKRYEMWESSVADRLGLGVAVAQCHDIGPLRIHQISSSLAARLRHGLKTVAGVRMRDAPTGFDEAVAAALGASRCAIVAFDASGAGVASQTVHDALVAHKIAITLSSPYHTFDDGLWSRPPIVRFSPSYYNTEDEVDRVVEVVRGAISTRDLRGDGRARGRRGPATKGS